MTAICTVATPSAADSAALAADSISARFQSLLESEKLPEEPHDLAAPAPEVVVRGYQSKDKLCRPACKANGRDVTFPDGKKLFMGSSGTGVPTDGSDPTEKK